MLTTEVPRRERGRNSGERSPAGLGVEAATSGEAGVVKRRALGASIGGLISEAETASICRYIPNDERG